MFNDNFARYSTREGMIISKWIDNTEWLANNFEKGEPDNTGFHDYKMWLKDGTVITIEVKEEEYYWFGKTGNIGLDFISAFHFKNTVRERYWKKNKNYWIPINEINTFLNHDIDVAKWGKLKTCDADIQLFYVENNGKIVFIQAYNNNSLQDKGFLDYIKDNYRLRINKKSDYGLKDNWESAAFFIKPDDKRLVECSIRSLGQLKESVKIE